MRVLVFIVLFAVCDVYGRDTKRHVSSDDSEVVCGVGGDDVVDYRRALYDFTLNLYKRIAFHTQGHFAVSPLTIWQSLAAIADATNGSTRQQLFKLLGLPEDDCARQNFYHLAASREPVGYDVSLARNRHFFIDEGIEIVNDWESLAQQQFNLITSSLPLKRAPQDAALLIRHTISSQITRLNFEGNSVLADSLDYNGLWTESFPETRVSQEPFYDHNGDQIGLVDMMRTRTRVRLAFIEQLNSKVIEIPVGVNGRYRMLFAVPVAGHDISISLKSITNTVLFDIIEALEETAGTYEIAIPRFVMTTECDVRALLEEMGIVNLWSDASATGNISRPPASPSSFIQRVQVTIDSHGLSPHVPDFTEYIDPVPGTAVVDRPFMYGLFDAETYTCLFGAAFSVPTYRL